MPSLDVIEKPEEEPKQEEATLSKPIIGIIYPPPEVRNIVDKTASFVARNGPEFENRIRQNEINNSKFNFLNPADAYHAYYQHKVKEFREGKGQEPAVPKILFQHQRPQEPVKIPEVFVPKDPPPEFEFVADPPSISAYELDVVKLTAQFVARNGRQFLTTVMQREQRNYLFDFLRPQHSLFSYFTKLVEQYTKILIPPKNLKESLGKESQGYKEILEQVRYRVEWLKFQERERKKEEDALEKERVAYAQIDWHDFVVVETVDFQPNESGNLPPPTTPSEVGARILTQERYEKGEIAMDDAVEMEVESDEEEEEDEGGRDEGHMLPSLPPPPKHAPHSDDVEPQDMEEDSDEEDDRPQVVSSRPKVAQAPAPPPPPPPPPTEAPPLPPTPDQVIIRRDYNPKARTVPQEEAPDMYMISPITKEKIPTSKVQDHMRIGLLDPKWMEDRQRSMAEKQEQEEVIAAGSDIDISLRQLAERRTDIFGVGTEETQIGKKIGEEDKKATKVVWDGHTASMEKVSQRARENISIEEQIATIHKTKGLVPDEEKEKIGPAMPKGPPVPLPPPPPVTTAPAPPPPVTRPVPPPPAPPVSRPPPPPMQAMARPVGMPQGLIMMPGPAPMHPMGMNPMMGMQPPMPPVQPPLGMRPGPPGVIGHQPPVAPAQPPPPSEEPPSKKQKTEDNLIPEDVFLQKNKGPVTVKVVIPNVVDKPEWKLNGQTLEYTLPLTDTISVLKAKLNESLGMPAGKQKLQYEGIFVKDSNTLAFYNFVNGASVQLQMKERGGRKK
ncbi:splicing factor 3A subunit 1-like [Pomacea canaliculata]|uniref:splicing factor 3A subunit 1-like n=1 Tax=Pomacea canaliculata TaxID=400727 RepID=UPI000D730926|nr:splicing factor 3A subunit 1-like [Pomacea canaliculata]